MRSKSAGVQLVARLNRAQEIIKRCGGMGIWSLAFDSILKSSVNTGSKTSRFVAREQTCDEFVHVGAEHLDSDSACTDLVACRAPPHPRGRHGHAGYTNAYTVRAGSMGRNSQNRAFRQQRMIARAFAPIDPTRDTMTGSQRDFGKTVNSSMQWYEATEDLRCIDCRAINRASTIN